jgi:ubiquinone/menaquinone biosynthesis C-methylase UbiE
MGLDNVLFEPVDAEKMIFQDAEFDIVCGFGILDHLELDLALRQLARVCLSKMVRVSFSSHWGTIPLNRVFVCVSALPPPI